MNEPQKEVSEIDILHLKLLRANVTRFMRESGNIWDKAGIRLLDIAPQDHEGATPWFPQAAIETLDIAPEAGATYTADLCKNNQDIIASERYDVVVCTEVLEHTLNPFAAVAEIQRVLKKGGVVLVSVPFNFRIHGPLPDCWRISEHGLRSLFSREHGFDILNLTPLEDPNRFLMPIHYTLTGIKI